MQRQELSTSAQDYRTCFRDHVVIGTAADECPCMVFAATLANVLRGETPCFPLPQVYL